MSVDPSYMHTTPPPTPSQPALRVWLVEDDASIRWVLERALRASGMVPRAFDAAEPALVALRSDAPDVLLTDIRMPGSSGIDLLREVRGAHPTLAAPEIDARAAWRLIHETRPLFARASTSC